MIGTTVSHYKILEKPGGGGMGVVLQVHDITLNRFVALVQRAVNEDGKTRRLTLYRSTSILP